MTPQEEIDALRAATREAHEVLKDLRAERKAARELLDGIRDDVNTRLEAEVREQVAKLGRATERAMADAVAKVSREFARLEAVFTGTDRVARRKGQEPLEDLIRRAAGS